ncbi:MAG: hypothetical protein EXX96DRAFT_543318 [Benjaminiella poitrasii]|nr:MAG: hypothetical protein EXX96DRAFT_543318 [Benjaminiella poitrasii]
MNKQMLADIALAIRRDTKLERASSNHCKKPDLIQLNTSGLCLQKRAGWNRYLINNVDKPTTDTAEASVSLPVTEDVTASRSLADDSVSKASSRTDMHPASGLLKKLSNAHSSAVSSDQSLILPSGPSTSDSMPSTVSPSGKSSSSDSSTDFLGTNPVPSASSPHSSLLKLLSTQPSTSTIATAPASAAALGRKAVQAGKRKESQLAKFVNAKDPAKLLSEGKDVPLKKDTQGRKSVKRDSSHFSEMIITAQENLRKRQRAESPVFKAIAILSKLELYKTKFSSDRFFDHPEFEHYGVQGVLTVKVFTDMSSYEKLFALLIPEQYTIFMNLLTTKITKHATKEVFDNIILRYVRLATVVTQFVNNDAELIRVIMMGLYKSRNPCTNVIAVLANHNEATSPFSLWEEAFQAGIIIAVKRYRMKSHVLKLYEKVVSLFDWKSMPPTVSEIIDINSKLLSR